MLRKLADGTPLRGPLQAFSARRYRAWQLAAWEQAGRPYPAAEPFKHDLLREYARRYGLRILVETGTFQGGTVEALRREFDRVYSIELSAPLYENARKRFAGRRNVEILFGDSGVELGKLLPRLDRPALFWLDGHYCGGLTAKAATETPIFEELGAILASPDRGHVILIDDARCFGTYPDYPTLEALTDFVRTRRAAVDIAVRDDCIRVTPKSI